MKRKDFIKTEFGLKNKWSIKTCFNCDIDVYECSLCETPFRRNTKYIYCNKKNKDRRNKDHICKKCYKAFALK